MRLWVYAVRRAALALPVVIGIMTVVFVFVSTLPETERTCSFYPPSGKVSPCTTTIVCAGNPNELCANPVYQSAVNALGLNQPIYVQWAIYVGNALTLNWGYVAQGTALGTGETGVGLLPLAGHSVTSVLAIFLPYSIELLLLTFLITLLVVVPIQTRAKAHPGGAAEHLAHALSLPGYGISLVLIVIPLLFLVELPLGGPVASSPICGSTSTVFLDFYRSWPQPPCTALYGTTNINPQTGYPSWLAFGYISTPTGFPTLDSLLHGDGWLALDTLLRLVLPALLLALVAIAVLFRSARFSRPEQRNLPFLLGARAQGIPETRVVRHHASRHALGESLSAIGPALLLVLWFLPVIEVYFNLWGVGLLGTYSVIGSTSSWDFGVFFGTFLACALILLVVKVVLDVARAYIDPRFRPE